jgi:hypothetical protein
MRDYARYSRAIIVPGNHQHRITTGSGDVSSVEGVEVTREKRWTGWWAERGAASPERGNDLLIPPVGGGVAVA